KRNDVVVFNFPAGDTVINRDEYQSLVPYYDVMRNLGRGNIDLGRKLIMEDPETYPLVTRPVDKKENYIKRCVAIAGDTLLIKDGIVHIDNLTPFLPAKSECPYYVLTNGQPLDADVLKEEYDVDIDNIEEFQTTGQPNLFRILLTNDARAKMEKVGFRI